jgi:phytoene dehydrogenase-like protein
MAGYDVIVIGAGHNGLVAGTLLAKAGRKVLVLERREVAGGQLANEAWGEGFGLDPLHAGGGLRPDIARELGLAPDADDRSASYVSLLPDGGRLALRADAHASEAIRPYSARDAGRWPEFVAFMDAAAGFLDAAYRTPMPRLPTPGLRQGLPLAQLAWKLRRLGRRDMFRVLRAVTMSALELTEEWFESEVLRAAIAAVAIHGVTLGPMSAGTGYTLMHQWLNRGGLAQRQRNGGSGQLAADLVAALKHHGGELRTGAAVQRVRIEGQRARGVVLASGEEIAARHVLATADPRHSLLDLVGAPELPPEFVWQAQSIKLRGSVAKLHWLTDGSHGLPEGTLVVAPTIRYLERAFDAAKYGELSAQPYLEITTRGNVVSAHFQFAPFSLRQGDWASTRAQLERIATDTLSAHVPSFAGSVRQLRSITPADLQTTWGLTEGDLNHGQLILDQLFILRPIAGWSAHATPIEGFYLGGSGTHGGGGISGAAGRNAARVVLGAGGG